MNNTTILQNHTHSNPFNEDAHVAYKDTLERGMLIVSMVIYSLAFVLGVLGNGLVIVITGFCMKRTVNTVWFLNLAIADFIFTFFLPLSIVYTARDFDWPLGEAMCKINSSLAFFNLYASVYLLMVISVDRCLSVRCPVWARNHRTPQLAYLVALVVWVLALALSSPNFYFRGTSQSRFHDKIVLVCTGNYGPTKEHQQFTLKAMTISRFIFGFAIPFSVIVFCYGAIVLKLRSTHLAPSSKPLKIITAVIVAFFVCWFPYHVFAFLELNEHGTPLVVIGSILTTSLAYLNSCLNPILYVFMGHDFKEKLRRSLRTVLEHAFLEESNLSTTNTKVIPSTELELLS
ncbi:chemerin-like receptor 1 [Hemicordylus capensis]|uniref:chemerin-like receptor 1 n=1 Tax=Hemicordylus capensis TaxID=884348 RepID=UPI0023037D93|nr:chemerin-like receptor 1 [Hemicordylus capensis]